MFYSEAILSRRGPLGKVWLAAHMERKLSKTQTLQTDVSQSVDAIMGQEIEVMALRLSGQLLLGVVRIYSRKAKYLLDDCNEALLKIKMAFRPGIVDMTEDQLAVNKNAITLQGNNLDLDLLLPDVNWDVDFEDRPVPSHGQHEARMADITLAMTDDFQLNGDDFGADDFNLGPSDGIGSQDFGDIDLGLDWGDGTANMNDDSMSIGVGRDAPAPEDDVASHIRGRNGADMDLDLLSNRSKSRPASEHAFGAEMDVDMPDFGGMDLADLGVNFDGIDPLLDNREKTPGQSSSRASSPLTEPPTTPEPDEPIASQTLKAKRKPKKQIIDSVIELEGGPGTKGSRGRGGLGAPVTKDVSDIVTDQHFIPRSSVVMRLLEIRNDPLAHFLPTKTTQQGTFFCAGPPGLPPVLADMFMRPITNTVANKRRGAQQDSPNKRAKLNGDANDDDIEQARRAGSVAPSLGMGSDVLGRRSIGPDGALDFGDQTMGLDDFQMDVPEFDAAGGADLALEDRARSVLTDRSRLSTPGLFDEGEPSYADAACPIATFDVRPSQSQAQGAEREPELPVQDSKGYSKNTVKALAIIRRELQPVPDEEDQDKVLSFRKMADKASRRAAASFFFELLVLGTRDCVRLSQESPFANIEVRAKEKLWEHQLRHGSPAPSHFAPSVTPSRMGSVAPSQRAVSVARSIGSAMGL